MGENVIGVVSEGGGAGEQNLGLQLSVALFLVLYWTIKNFFY